MASPLLFAWDEDTPSMSNIEPMWHAAMNSDPATIGAEAAEGLAAKDSGRRCLKLFNVAESASGVPLIRDGTSYTELLADGYQTGAWTDRMRTFWQAYKDADGPRPDLLVADWEEYGTDSTVEGAEAGFQRILNIEGLRKKLPTRLQGITAAQFASGVTPLTTYAWAKILWNRVVFKRVAEALRRIVCSSWVDVFGTACPGFSNYITDHNRSSPSLDLFGWPNDWTSNVNGVSAPECYLEGTRAGTWAYFTSGVSSLAPRWANAVRNIDVLRRTRGRITPWIGPFKYAGTASPASSDVGDKAYLKHIALNGIGTWLLFNASAPDQEDLNDYVAGLTVATDVKYRGFNPAEVAIGGTLTTGSFSTTYTQSHWT